MAQQQLFYFGSEEHLIYLSTSRCVFSDESRVPPPLHRASSSSYSNKCSPCILPILYSWMAERQDHFLMILQIKERWPKIGVLRYKYRWRKWFEIDSEHGEEKGQPYVSWEHQWYCPKCQNRLGYGDTNSLEEFLWRLYLVWFAIVDSTTQLSWQPGFVIIVKNVPYRLIHLSLLAKFTFRERFKGPNSICLSIIIQPTNVMYNWKVPMGLIAKLGTLEERKHDEVNMPKSKSSLSQKSFIIDSIVEGSSFPRRDIKGDREAVIWGRLKIQPRCTECAEDSGLRLESCHRLR